MAEVTGATSGYIPRIKNALKEAIAVLKDKATSVIPRPQPPALTGQASGIDVTTVNGRTTNVSIIPVNRSIEAALDASEMDINRVNQTR